MITNLRWLSSSSWQSLSLCCSDSTSLDIFLILILDNSNSGVVSIWSFSNAYNSEEISSSKVQCLIQLANFDVKLTVFIYMLLPSQHRVVWKIPYYSKTNDAVSKRVPIQNIPRW